MNIFPILESNKYYSKILEIIYKKIGIDKFEVINYDNCFIAFRFNSPESYKFELVFWLNENRLSFNIEDWYEIIDSHFVDDKDASEVFDFINTILKNKVLIEEEPIRHLRKTLFL